MDLLRARFPQKADDARRCGAADDGIIDEDDALVPDGFGDDVQLDAHGVFAHLLAGGDEAAADILVLQEADAVGDAALLRVADGCIDAGIRHADDDIRIHGIFAGQEPAGIQPRSVYAPPLEDGIRAGEVDVLKDAQARASSAVPPV